MSLYERLQQCVLSTHCRDVALFQRLRRPLSAIYTAKRCLIRRYLACHTRQISSFGGAGTSTICSFFEAMNIGLPKITEGDWAPWKHMRHPPLDQTVQRAFRALYVVGDPRDAILSVFRRGYQHWHIQRLEGDVKTWNYSWDLERFLSAGRDHFRLRQHFDNWVNARRSYPIMVMKYDALWDHLPEIFQFMGAPLESVEQFPRRKARNVNWLSEAKQVRDALNDLYGDLAEDIAKMEDIRVLLPQ